MSKELALYLANERVVARWQLANAIEVYELYPDSICLNLVRLGYLDEDTYLDYAAEFYKVERINEERLAAIPDRILRVIPRDLAAMFGVLPIGIHRNQLTVVMSPPIRKYVISRLKFFTGYNIRPVITKHDDFVTAMKRFYSLEFMPLKIAEHVHLKYEKRRPMGEADVSDLSKISSLTSTPSQPATKAAVATAASVPQGEAHLSRLHVIAEKVDAALAEDASLPEDIDNAIEERVDAMFADGTPGAAKLQQVPQPAEAESEPLQEIQEVQAIEFPVGESGPEEEQQNAFDVERTEASAEAERERAESAAEEPTEEAEPSDLEAELKRLNERFTEARSRDEIIEHSFKFLSRFAKRIIFFAVKKKLATGFAAQGVELDRDKIRSLELDLNLVSLIRASVENLQPFIGEPFEDEAVAQIVKFLGGEKPEQVAVIPIHIKERPVGFFYMDGTKQEVSLDYDLATQIKKLVSAAFQTLILAKKLGV